MSAATFRPRNLLWPLLFAGIAAASSSGCEIALIVAATADDDDDDGCYGECCYGDCWTDDGVTPPPSTPSVPEMTIDIPDWPPVGPDGEVEVTASIPTGALRDARFIFRNTVTKTFGGATTAGAVSAFGDELGEGFGTLTIEVNGLNGTGARKEVEKLLVDLTAPSSYTDDNILPAQGADLYFWIADAWVVSGYELVIGGKTFTETLEPGYPSTLGVEWDYSLVSIPVEELPLGVHNGDLRVWDAAGNEATFDFPLTIDGLPPEATVEQPTDGSTVSGTFPVTVAGLDDLPGAVSLEIRVGGALVATGLGPSATVVLDANEFPAGPIEITAIAVDEAGNKSPPSVRTVTISHP
ncbi:MAG: Ig-like domain-containing protein [Polyangiaceae bacterium]|nr:Ig-like domain-containing protein [Polyangiaceae bacterium]